jgi:hypothetical protein
MADNFYREFIPNDRPRTVLVRPILTADQPVAEEQLVQTIASILQQGAIQIATSINPITPLPIIMANATGYLQMRNMDNTAHAHLANVPLLEINPAKLWELFGNATTNGSNPDLTVYTVEWDFWVNPNTVITGGFRGKALDHTCQRSNKTYAYDGVEAGCAAICAAVFLIKTLPEHAALRNQLGRKTSDRRIFDIAIALQDKLSNIQPKNRLDS